MGAAVQDSRLSRVDLFYGPTPDLVLRLRVTAALIPVRCDCHRLLLVGQILGVLQLRCGGCRKLVQIEPVSGD